jgi:N-acetylglutamate synthase-like GNAT family acetyltransferase
MNTCLADRPTVKKSTAARRRRTRHLLASLDSMWVCNIGGHVVGTVGLRRVGPDAVRLSLFHVDPEWQHTSVPAKLVGCVRSHFQHAGLSQIVMDPRVAPQWVGQLLGRRGFHFDGYRDVLGKRDMEFHIEHGT